MDKKLLLAVVISVVFAGLSGFYAGRFYEVRTFRRNLANGNGVRNFPSGNFGSDRPRYGQGQNLAPTDETIQNDTTDSATQE